MIDYNLCLLFFLACWETDPHLRPSFKDILQELDLISRSSFALTPNESFHTMQDGWKKEIAEVLQELRMKEKVNYWIVHIEIIKITSPFKPFLGPFLFTFSLIVIFSILFLIICCLLINSKSKKAFKSFEEVSRSSYKYG